MLASGEERTRSFDIEGALAGSIVATPDGHGGMNQVVTASAAGAAPRLADGSEQNLVELGTYNGLRSGTPPAGNPTVGINAESNRVVSTVDYSLSVTPSRWNVNTASGNAATAGYMASDGIRPGNSNLGLHLGEATGQGLRVDGSGGRQDDDGYIGIRVNQSSMGSFDQDPVDPLVLDLDGNGVQLNSYGDAPVLFDADNDGGSLEQTGWVSGTDGILVHDLNNNGRIDHMGEALSEYYNGVSGSEGVAGTKPHGDGFAALRSLDSNNDGIFNASDAAYAELKVWVDGNHDGKSWVDANGNGHVDAGEASELQSLAALGITSINLSASAQSGEVRDGNEVLARGQFTQNGQVREAVAARFIANPAGSTITATSVGGVSGVTVATESGDAAPAVRAFVSGNEDAAQAETLDAAVLGVRHLTGGAGDDLLRGDAQDNWLAGGLGADRFDAGAGDDVLLIDAADTAGSGTAIDAGDGLDVVQVLGEQGVTLNLAQAHVEIAVGGEGDDVLISGGRSTVFVRGGSGNDWILGGTANDVLSGEDGNDVIDGGAGNDMVRGHRGTDQLLGGEGDDVIDGGLDDDRLGGGDGADVLIGGRGDDWIDGGAGEDVARYSGSYADYRITRMTDAQGHTRLRVVDTRTGQDGADTLVNVEKLSFADVARVALDLGSPLPAKDVLTADASGQTLGRSAPHLLYAAQLLANDRDWDSPQGELRIAQVLQAQGGTAVLTAGGDVLFTPDAGYRGVMSFRYTVQDAQGNVTVVTNPATGESQTLRAAAYLRTPDLPIDPLAVEQWYLGDTQVIAAWGSAAEQARGQGYSGNGVRIGQFEPGGPYSTGPEVFDYRHPDLAPNADRRWLNALDSGGAADVAQTFSQHATMVAGVMVAARNGEGGVGVAYGATLAGHYIQGEGLSVSELSAEITQALAKFKNYDVVNNSWGATQDFGLNVVPLGALQTGIATAVNQGRGGLGTAIVMAGGNDRAEGSNTNYNALTANRAVIVAASINAPGDLGTLNLGSRPFSNPGASILVAAPGSNIDSTSRELIGANGSTFGSDYDSAQGTSFAAPIVSGVVALMLEANPNLGYRDIQTILAMSATQVDDPNGTDWAVNRSRTWNGGGMHASHDYGFGRVDARAAVRLAETWYEQGTGSNEKSQGDDFMVYEFPASIADGTGALSRTRTMQAGLELESAQVSVSLTHANWGDLIIKLISPSGTESVLLNRPGKAPGSDASDRGDGTGRLEFSFNTTHVRGESSGGDWTLQVIDAAAGSVGTLSGWALKLYGSVDDGNDVYVYTDEFAHLFGRDTLSDGNGGRDILNASALSGNSSINLNSGSVSTLAGRQVTLQGDIEAGYGGDGNDTLVGNALSNVLRGGRGADTLDGGAGIDRLEGDWGDDMMTGGAGNDLFAIHRDPGSTDVIADFVINSPERIVLVGFESLTEFSQLGLTQAGADVRVDLGQNQVLVLRNQTLAQVTDQHFVFASNTSMLDAYVQRWGNNGLVLGSDAADNALLTNAFGDVAAYGRGGDDVLGSQTANDLIDGGSGNDTIWGEYPGYAPVAGADWIEGGAGNDVLRGGGGGDWLIGGSGNDALYGEDGNDALVGNSGADYLDGGSGDDLIALDGDIGTATLLNNGYYGTRVGGMGVFGNVFRVVAGGGGADGYTVYSDGVTAYNLVADFVTRGDRIDLSAFGAIQGFQDIQARTIGNNFEYFTQVQAGSGSNAVFVSLYHVRAEQLSAANFIFAPSTPGTYWGSAGDDVLTGNAGANTMDGRSGADTMSGRTGDDVYLVDQAADAVVELPGGGYDLVRSSVTYGLSDNVEALELGGLSDLNATGNAERNRLVGNAGHNRLDGGAEADEMVGGAGNDSYVVDDQLDRATENANEGTDTVEASVSWTLGAHFENLTLTGSASINATGNDLDNTLRGNSGDNILDGARGGDTLAGGGGSDSYYVDDTFDSVIEANDAGFDTVYSGVDFTLSANVEAGVLFGSAVRLSGNSLDNTLIGNAVNNLLSAGGGDDVIDGAAGADTMAGGLGNDVYKVDNQFDTVSEAAGEGVDAVLSSVTWTLGANLENLSLTGAANVNGVGNQFDNILSGNLGDNVLVGGLGSDQYLFGRGGAHDRISDEDASAGQLDVLSFGADIDAEQLWFRRVDSDLEISIIGSTDSVTVSEWFAGSAHRIEQIQTMDGRVLLESQVQALVSAMAAFAPPVPGESTLPASLRDALQPVLAASWQ